MIVVDALFTRSSLLEGSAGAVKDNSGGGVSRNEGKIGRPGDGPVEAAEILAALARDSTGAERRRVAVSRYLAAGEGWREASAYLGGAFAARDEWLRREEEE